MTLLREIDEFCERTGLSKTAFGLLSMQYGHLYGHLKRGRAIRPETAAKARSFIAANPDLEPPRKGPRPVERDPKEYIASRVRLEDRGFTSPCWVWQRCLNEKGYAQAIVPEFGRVRIHRASYELYVGPIADGLTLDHLCFVRSCCNPAHLEAVTNHENNRRAAMHRRRAAEMERKLAA